MIEKCCKGTSTNKALTLLIPSVGGSPKVFLDNFWIGISFENEIFANLTSIMTR